MTTETGLRSPRADRLRTRSWFTPAWLGLLIAVVHAASPSVLVGDSRLSGVTGWQFLTHFDLHLEKHPNVVSLAHPDIVYRDGHALPYFPWPAMLLSIPGDLVYWLLGKDPGSISLENPSRAGLIEIPSAAVVVAITALVLRAFVLGTGKAWATPRFANGSALLFAFGTSAWSVGSRALWQQTESMLFVSLALLAAQRLISRPRNLKWELWFGAFLACAAIVRPTNAVFVVVALAWLAWSRRRALLAAAGPLAVLLVAFALFSHSQYGDYIPPYYLPDRINSPPTIGFVEGLAMNLVGPSRGFAIYDPIFFLALAALVLKVRSRSLRSWELALWVAIVGQLLVIAKFGSTGGNAYGPRLMLDILPLVFVLSLPALAKVVGAGAHRGTAVLVAAALGFGLFVNGTGAVLRSTRCWNTDPITPDLLTSREWDWSDAQFLRPYRQLVHGGSIRDVMTPNCQVL